jgi:hypothetical protein
MTPITPGTTHAETAWFAASFPLWIMLALVLGGAAILRGPLLRLVQAELIRRARSRRAASGQGDTPIDPALIFIPVPLTAGQLISVGFGVVALGSAGLALFTPMFLALVLALPLGGATVWLVQWVAEQLYTAQIDRTLPAAVGRLSLQLRAGDSFVTAIEKVIADMKPGPLHTEWSFLRSRIGRPLVSGLLAPTVQVVRAMTAQTASPRHATFLAHLEVALTQPQDAQVKRVAAAYEALLEAEQRRSAAVTDMAQMRYGGFVIGGAEVLIVLYLASTQTDRFLSAYTGPFAFIALPLLLIALAAPFLAGVLLARVADMEY